jgi:hypothetical protein
MKGQFIRNIEDEKFISGSDASGFNRSLPPCYNDIIYKRVL